MRAIEVALSQPGRFVKIVDLFAIPDYFEFQQLFINPKMQSISSLKYSAPINFMTSIRLPSYQDYQKVAGW